MSDDDELKVLEREVERLRSSRRETPAAVADTSRDTESDEATELPLREVGPEGAAVHDSDRIIHDLALQLETVVQEMEETARERPVLALLGAFAVGVAVGKLFSRG